MCITKECDDPTEPGVYFREDDCWMRYSSTLESTIRDAYWDRVLSPLLSNNSSISLVSKSSLPLGNITSKKYPDGREYMADLKTMKQVNISSGYSRDIKIIPAPEDGLNLSGCTVLLEDLLHLITRETFMSKLIKDKHPQVIQVRYNKFLTGKPAIYTEFLEALKQAAATNKNLLQEMYSTVKQADSSELESLNFVFHGTPTQNLQSIMANGVDANRCRSSDRFWLGKDPETSRHYCNAAAAAPHATMVLFLELLGHGEADIGNVRTIPSDKSSVLLPVAEIDVRAPPPQRSTDRTSRRKTRNFTGFSCFPWCHRTCC